MADEKEYGIPRIIVPLAGIQAVPEEGSNPARTQRPEPGSSSSNPETSGALPYVMRSKYNGSIDPDDDTAPASLDDANPDTWERYLHADGSGGPPYRKTVAVSGVSTPGGSNPSVIATAAHGVPSDIGGTFTVLLAGLGTTPTINGLHQATYISATTFSIPVTVTATTDVVGTAAILTSGVSIDAEPRIRELGSGSYALFTRQKKFDRAGELYYISGETKTQLYI